MLVLSGSGEVRLDWSLCLGLYGLEFDLLILNNRAESMPFSRLYCKSAAAADTNMMLCICLSLLLLLVGC